jgi:hypothetical protein
MGMATSKKIGRLAESLGLDDRVIHGMYRMGFLCEDAYRSYQLANQRFEELLHMQRRARLWAQSQQPPGQLPVPPGDNPGPESATPQSAAPVAAGHSASLQQSAEQSEALDGLLAAMVKYARSEFDRLRAQGERENRCRVKQARLIEFGMKQGLTWRKARGLARHLPKDLLFPVRGSNKSK